jgi:XTP/dITP diphosphohydrolase
MKLVFATNNAHKAKEVSEILGSSFEILSLKDINCNEDIPETQETIEGNAAQKSFYVYDKFGANCFADDTGLEIEALNGEPGVYSARYAGKACNFDDNINKVLLKMKGIKNRKAQFKTVFSLVIDGKELQFEGIVKGTILESRRGENGFGYDPIFLPDGFDKTFAEMNSEEKNKISHRGIATIKLAEYLKSL